jgi:hypothetical protein
LITERVGVADGVAPAVLPRDQVIALGRKRHWRRATKLAKDPALSDICHGFAIAADVRDAHTAALVLVTPP